MEVFLILLLLVLIIMMISGNSGRKEDLFRMEKKLESLVREIQGLRQELTDQPRKEGSTWAPRPEPFKPEPPKPQPPPPKPAPVDPPVPAATYDILPPEPPRKIRPEPVAEARDFATSFNAPKEPLPAPYVPEESWFDKWVRNNPDLEKFIGENLINKIGIAVLVLGIGFFVKYAIGQGWITQTGRVCIGILCGGLLIGLAHYLRNSYRAFSSVLAGGGIAVFYFTIAFAFRQFGLLNQQASFGIMVVITGFAVALSVLYNKIELAVIAAVGGFLTPFLVSTGEGNYIVLFTYLIILNLGLLFLAYFKRWPLLNILSLFFTEIIFGAWMGHTVGDSRQVISYPLAMFFATAFYFIFLGMNMVHQLRKAQPFRPFDFFLLLFITCTYFAAGMTLLHYWRGGAYQGLFTLCMGVVNFSLAWFLYKRRSADRNLLYLLIGLTLSFISLAIPVQLHGHTITLFWSAEFVLLYWLYQRSRISVFRYSSAAIAILTLISLSMDWQQADMATPHYLPVIYTNLQGFVTDIVVAAAFTVFGLLLRKEEPDATYILDWPLAPVKKISFGIATLILFLTCIYGVNLYFIGHTSFDVPNAWHRLITGLFLTGYLYRVHRRSGDRYTWLQLGAVMAGYLFWLFSLASVTGLRNGVMEGVYPGIQLAVHGLAVLLLAFLLYRGIQVIRRGEISAPVRTALTWITGVLLVLFFSLEAMHLYVIAGYRHGGAAALEHSYGKAALTILWAASSFIFMWLGMRHKNRTLRIISLSLFGVVLGKLFLLDIRGISEGGKIAAFILLGVLLLTVSFMYQKLKKIIIDDRPE